MLGLGQIDRAWRTDLAFGVAYFSTRIAYTALNLYLHARFSTVRIFAPINAVVLLAHSVWFRQWLASYLRLLRNARKKEASPSAPAAVAPLPNF